MTEKSYFVKPYMCVGIKKKSKKKLKKTTPKCSYKYLPSEVNLMSMLAIYSFDLVIGMSELGEERRGQ